MSPFISTNFPVCKSSGLSLATCSGVTISAPSTPNWARLNFVSARITFDKAFDLFIDIPDLVTVFMFKLIC